MQHPQVRFKTPIEISIHKYVSVDPVLVTGYNPSNVNSPEVRNGLLIQICNAQFNVVLIQEMQHETVVLEKSWADMDSN